MTLEEFNSATEVLDKERERIVREYAEEHNPVKIGDFVESDYKTYIRVSKMTPVISVRGVPVMMYEGPTCKENGSPTRRQRNGVIYQQFVKKINGQPINQK